MICAITTLSFIIVPCIKSVELNKKQIRIGKQIYAWMKAMMKFNPLFEGSEPDFTKHILSHYRLLSAKNDSLAGH